MIYYYNEEIFTSLREAAADYLQKICKQNEDVKDNPHYYKEYSELVYTDISLKVYHVNDTDNIYFFEIGPENRYTDCGQLIDFLSADEDKEKDIISLFESENWIKNIDAWDIDADLEKTTIYECRNCRGSFFFIDENWYTFTDSYEDLKVILEYGPAYDDRLTLQDIHNLESYDYVEVNIDRVKEYLQSQCRE